MIWPGVVYHIPQPLWDEAEHPRHPRGTSRGGQFRDKTSGGVGLVSGGSERWVQSALTGIGIDLDEDQVRDAVARGRQVGRTPLYGGSIGQTSIVTMEMPDGQRLALVHKIQDPAMSDNEVWASRIGRAIGAPVPAVIYDPDDETAIYMPYIEGHSATERAAAMANDEEYAHVYSLAGTLTEEHGRSRSGALLGLLDIALLNADRHPGNWMIDLEGQAWGIDHTHITPSLTGADYEGYEDFGTMVEAGETPLTVLDIAEARARIGNLVDSGRIPAKWGPGMLYRLQRLQDLFEQRSLPLSDRLGSPR